MTLHEVARQINHVNVGGWYNREKMGKGWLENYLKHLFYDDSVQHVYLETALPDGWWYMSVYRLKDGGFDYNLPDTREQEQKIINALFGK